MKKLVLVPPKMELASVMTTDPGRRNQPQKGTTKSATLAGIGSLFDLRGAATCRNISSLMQPGRPKTSVKGSFSTAMRRRPI